MLGNERHWKPKGRPSKDKERENKLAGLKYIIDSEMRGEPISHTNVLKATGLGKSTVSKYLSDFKKRNIIEDVYGAVLKDLRSFKEDESKLQDISMDYLMLIQFLNDRNLSNEEKISFIIEYTKSYALNYFWRSIIVNETEFLDKLYFLVKGFSYIIQNLDYKKEVTDTAKKELIRQEMDLANKMRKYLKRSSNSQQEENTNE